MHTLQVVLLIINIVVCLALIGVVLMQRSEGGALGVGGGPSGMMSVRGAGDLLTRTTWILFSIFLAICLTLTILGGTGERSVADQLKDTTYKAPVAPALPTAPPGAVVPSAPAAVVPSAPSAVVPATPVPAPAPAAARPAAPAVTPAPAARRPAPAATPAAPAPAAAAPAPAVPVIEAPPPPAPAPSSAPAP